MRFLALFGAFGVIIFIISNDNKKAPIQKTLKKTRKKTKNKNKKKSMLTKNNFVQKSWSSLFFFFFS
jgi:hypothetical protein